MKAILKWGVSVDDQWHEIGNGKVLRAETINGIVYVWTHEAVNQNGLPFPDHPMRRVRVVGTGQPLDDQWIPLATAPGSLFVWHVMEDGAPA